MHRGYYSSYASVQFELLSNRRAVMDLKETFKHRVANICWMGSSLLASVDVIKFQTTDAYSSLDITNVIYNLCINSRDEKVKVMQRTRPNS
jgi:hypothetical protein